MRETIAVNGKILSAVSMTGQLQGNARLCRDRQAVRIVNEQDAGHIPVQGHLPQDRSEPLHIRRIVIMDAHDLQSVENDFFVLEHADSGLPDGIEIFRGAGELLVVARDEVSAQRRGKFSPGFGQPREVHGGPVIQVARDEQHVRMQLRKFPDDAAEKAGVSHVAEMQIADQGGCAARARQPEDWAA